MQKLLSNNSCRSALLALLIIITASCSADPSAPIFEHAERALAEAKYDEALSQYTYLVNKHPDSVHASQSQYKIAYILNRYLGDDRQAQLAYKTLFYMYPKSKEANVALEDLAIIYSNDGDHRKAIENYQKILGTRVPDENRRIHYRIAMEYFYMNDLAQSAVEYKELLKNARKPELVSDIYFQLGSIEYIEGRYPDALEWFDKIINKYPDTLYANEARFSKARLLRESGKYAEALSILNSIEKDYPDKQAVTSLKGWVERKIDEGPEPKETPESMKK